MAYDSWSQHNEQVVPFTGAVTNGTLATVVAASTGFAWNVRSLTVTSTVSGTVAVYSGGTIQSNSLIGAFGVLANTPLVLAEDQLGQGVVTAVGQALTINCPTGTTTLTARIRKDTTSPNAAH